MAPSAPSKGAEASNAARRSETKDQLDFLSALRIGLHLEGRPTISTPATYETALMKFLSQRLKLSSRVFCRRGTSKLFAKSANRPPQIAPSARTAIMLRPACDNRVLC